MSENWTIKFQSVTQLSHHVCWGFYFEPPYRFATSCRHQWRL